MQYSIENILMNLFKSSIACVVIGLVLKALVVAVVIYCINKKYQLLKGRKVIKCVSLVAGVLVSNYIALLIYNADVTDIMVNRYNELFGWLMASAIVLCGAYYILDVITMKGNNLVKAAGVVIMISVAHIAISPVHHRIMSACGAYDYMQNFLKVCGWIVIMTFVAYGFRYLELIVRFRRRKKAGNYIICSKDK